jgi:hypothetical protein
VDELGVVRIGLDKRLAEFARLVEPDARLACPAGVAQRQAKAIANRCEFQSEMLDRLPLEQPFKPAVKLPRPTQELGAERVELFLFQEQVFANAGVKCADRPLGQREPGSLPLVGCLEVGVGLDLAPVREIEASVGCGTALSTDQGLARC